MFGEILYQLEKFLYINKFLGILISLFAGIISSFSPCIYPLIPITLSIIGITASNSNLKNFKIIFFFIFGIITIFTILGIIASLFGILLNKFFNNFLVYIFLAVLFLFLGLVSFNLIKLNIFFRNLNFKINNYFSIYILGIISALSLAPCNLPILGTILTLISFRKNILYGITLLFFFSIGYTFLIFLVALFSSLINKLPKSLYWSIILNKVFGVILFIMSGYFFFKFINLFL